MARGAETSKSGTDWPASRFSSLLEGFQRLRGSGQTLARTARFRELLDGLVASRDKARVFAPEKCDQLLAGHEAAIERDRVLQESTADDFNLLDVLDLTYSEIRHSMVLAWLLDANHRKHGTHAQGNLGFRLFLRELHLPESLAADRYWVSREVPGDESRVDIEIGRRGHFLIHIENKIRAGEGKRQTDREWCDLQRRAASLFVPDVRKVCGFFLTPSGEAAGNASFVPLSWGRIARVLEQFAEQAKPVDVKLFAAHYARALRRFILRDESEGEERDETEGDEQDGEAQLQ